MCGLDFPVLFTGLVTVSKLRQTSCSPAWSSNPGALTVAPGFIHLRAPTYLKMAMPRAPARIKDSWVGSFKSLPRVAPAGELSFQLLVCRCPGVAAENSRKGLGSLQFVWLSLKHSSGLSSESTCTGHARLRCSTLATSCSLRFAPPIPGWIPYLPTLPDFS